MSDTSDCNISGIDDIFDTSYRGNVLAGILLPAFYLKVRKFMGLLHLYE